jgi:4-amino-4-deoxy-L-arabinose transferase-like glycosyltransferase
MTDNLIKLTKSPGTWAVGMGAIIILPFLGGAGLWDPWETHYAEVARRMVADGDWLTPRWRQELFFSKPIFIFWMMASSFKIFGISAWAARIPFALIGILGIFLTYRFVARLTDYKRGLWAAGVLITSPFYFLISRQAITDIVFCVFLLGTLGCFILVALEDQPKKRDILGIYIFAALAALAKTPVGLAIPGTIILAYLLFSGNLSVLKKVKPHWGIPVFLAIAAPWYLTMTIMYKAQYFNEFFIDHNIQRAFAGVHGDRSTFEYFVKQLAYGFFPWVGIVPLAFGRTAISLKEDHFRSKEPSAKINIKNHLTLFLILWFCVAFTTFTLMVTKFHHYIFPALPPLAILCGLVLAEQQEKLGWWILAPIGAAVLAMIANDVVSSETHLSHLYDYKYDRPLPAEHYPRFFIFVISVIFGAILFAMRWIKNHRLAVSGLAVLASIFTIQLAWFYQNQQGHAMSQQDLFDTYQRLAKPGDKLYQYQMNWRGEVFYSNDTIIKLSNQSAVQKVLKNDNRVFIISVAESFSAIDHASRKATGKHLHILPGSNIRYTLSSNQLEPGIEDLSPIPENIFKSIPKISHPVKAEFEEGVTFLGYDVKPENPATGGEFEISFYFRAEKQIKKDWQVFVHIDANERKTQRIHGDHYPVKGIFKTNRWFAGDIIKDTITLRVPRGFPPTEYTVYLGFYIDDRRMKVKSGSPQDGKNRVQAGTLKIR